MMPFFSECKNKFVPLGDFFAQSKTENSEYLKIIK